VPARALIRSRSLVAPALLVAAASLALAACGARPATPPDVSSPAPARTLTVLVASSLAPALEEALGPFRAAHPEVTVRVDAGGSFLLARRVVELGHPCDLLLAADVEALEVFQASGAEAAATPPAGPPRTTLLEPPLVFAGGSIAIACAPDTDLARDLAALPAELRLERLARPGVRIARVSPEGAPIGVRALQVMALADRHAPPPPPPPLQPASRGAGTPSTPAPAPAPAPAPTPGLAARLLANAPDDLVRPQLPVVEALVLSGAADACLDYPASARAKGLAVFALPPSIDLSDPRRAAAYAQVAVEVPVPAGGKTRRVTAAPIRYAAAIPASAQEPALARALAALLASPEGQALLTRHGHTPREAPASPPAPRPGPP